MHLLMNSGEGRQKRRWHSLLSPGPQGRPECNCSTSQLLDLIRILPLRHKLDNTSGMRECEHHMLWIMLTCLKQQAICDIDHLRKEVDSAVLSGWTRTTMVPAGMLFPFLRSLIKKDTSLLKSDWLPQSSAGVRNG